MDVEIAGLNKVVCRASNGTVVTISNTLNSWTKTVSGGVATFMIPSMPAPAKRTYTVSKSGYSRNIELGFGDSIDITLDTAHEPATKGDVSSLQSSVQSSINSINSSISSLQTAINNINNSRLTSAEVTWVRSHKSAVSGKTVGQVSKSGTTLNITSLTL